MSSCGVLTNGYGRRGDTDPGYLDDDLDRNDNRENFLKFQPKVESLPKKKRGRQKKTVPKPHELEHCCNGMDVNMEAAAAFPPPWSRRDFGTPDGSMCEDDEDEEDEELDVQDFRRFSSRARKPTDFFGVLPDRRNHVARRSGGRGGRGGRRGRSTARRMLRFDTPADILMITQNQTPSSKVQFVYGHDHSLRTK